MNHENVDQKQTEEFDLYQLYLDLKRNWLVLIGLTFGGVILSAVAAFSIEREYRPSVHLALPSESTSSQFNTNGILELDRQALFQSIIRSLLASDNFRQFLTEEKLFAELFDGNESYDPVWFSRLDATRELEVVFSASKDGRVVDDPLEVKLSMIHSNEELIVDVLNRYVRYCNSLALNNFAGEINSIKTDNLKTLNRQLSVLLEDAKYKRELEIKRLEEENRLKLKTLVVERDSLIERLTFDRMTEIQSVREAAELAKTLNIVKPTNLSELNTSIQEVDTKILLSNEQQLPLYLMGTEYLTALEKTLNDRQNDAVFSRDVNEKNRVIAQLQSDPRLEELRNRLSDEPYVEGIAELRRRIFELESVEVNFEGLELYTVSSSAKASGIPLRPDRKMIVLAGSILSGLIAIGLVIISSSIRRRETSI